MTHIGEPTGDIKITKEFIDTVGKLIALENAGQGKGHFSGGEFHYNDLNEDDVRLLQLFKDSFHDVITKLDNEPTTITGAYFDNLKVSLKNIGRVGQNATQKTFRAYMNNKFAGLFGYLQLYVYSKTNANDKGADSALAGLRSIYAVYRDALHTA